MPGEFAKDARTALWLFRRIFSWDFLRRATFPAMTLIGLGMIALGFLFDDTQSDQKLRHDILEKVGEVIFVTAAISMFVNSFVFIGVFRDALVEVLTKRKDLLRDAAKEALADHTPIVFESVDRALDGNHTVIHRMVHDVFYSTQHLRSRSDLAEIFGRVSGAVYNHRFPALAPTLHDAIIALLPVNRDFYYGPYEREIEIDWHSPNESQVMLTENVDFEIIPAERDKEIHYDYSCLTDSRTPTSIAGILEFELTIMGYDSGRDRVFGKEILRSEQIADRYGGTALRQSYSVPLTGHGSYRIRRYHRRIIALAGDPTLDCRSLQIIQGPLRLRVRSLTDDLTSLASPMRNSTSSKFLVRIQTGRSGWNLVASSCRIRATSCSFRRPEVSDGEISEAPGREGDSPAATEPHPTHRSPLNADRVSIRWFLSREAS